MEEKPIIILFKENEINISKLYSLYAEKIPEKKDFWKKLADEEIAHAAYINKNIGADGNALIKENKFSRGIVRYVMDFVQKEIDRAEKKRISHDDALRSALRIERSILEKKCFEIFSPSNTAIEKVFKKMNDETEKHLAILIEEIKSY
ncbi:MAG: hypothetical protein PHH24_00315 [Candidatus Moranbacteria bacterium]|jgi:hypothetical protein|nr:hypothetical protein [Candidatus Moranbacteria bacterium]MDD5652078.1 hypothetical protein [Candidatus Moranbacteria bacterium]MDX9855675.1 hypothetical protein [Candidatus Moranbacteria bacterium]